MPGLQCCFMIPCDLHGIQLLISDILTTPPFNSLKDRANQLVGHFKHSPKQLSIFYDLQKQEYTNPQALVMAKEIRWGTHYKEFVSILANKQALRKWTIDSRINFVKSKGAQAICQTIVNSSFFPGLEELVYILDPIIKAQIESEADNAHLCLVKGRWQKLEEHLRNCQALSSTNLEPILKKFEERYKRQVNDLHQLAFWLCPTNNLAGRLEEGELTRILSTLQRYISDSDWPTAKISFLHYYSRQGPFSVTNAHWEEKDDTVVFWLLYNDVARPLSEFVLRLMKTTANSVPSERNFSSMKIIHSPTRNRLTPQRVDKLLFVYINRRVLNRQLNASEDSEDDIEEASEVEFERFAQDAQDAQDV